MNISTNIISLETKNKQEFICLNNKVENLIKKSRITKGLVFIFSRHTTFAIQINEFESCLLKDICSFMNNLVPKKSYYFHDNFKLRKNVSPNEKKNGDSHLKAILLASSRTIPIKDSQMLLGKWQSVFGIELDGPRKREIVVQIIGT